MSNKSTALVSNPAPECDLPDCCDLSCVWPGGYACVCGYWHPSADWHALGGHCPEAER